MERLRQLRKEYKKTQQIMSDYLKITQQAYAAYENGKAQPPLDIASRLADYFDVSVDYLLGRTEDPSPVIHPSNEYIPDGYTDLPVIGIVAAGYDGLAQEEYDGMYGVVSKALKGYPKEECFILRVSGDSMYPDFQDRDLVVVHRQSSVDSGDVAVVLYDGDSATLKRVEYETGKNWVRLVPRNPEYKTKTIKGCDLEMCHVLGKVVSLVFREV